MKDRRIVITGIGAVSPLGNTAAETWAAMKEGRSGIGIIESIDTTPFPVHIAGEVKNFDATPYFKKDPKAVRRCDRFEQLAMGAAVMAMEDAGLDPEKVDKNRVGVMIGSGIGGLGIHSTNCETLVTSGPRRVSPFCIPYMITNMASGMVSMDYGFGGPNMSISTACATSNHCIGEAWRIMKFGDADVMICGGAEATVLPIGITGFANMKALSTRNDDPATASRPYDVDRDGFVMSEGAGVIILETLEHAQARGARILAELVGYGLSADAYHLTSPMPEGEGASRCMQMALEHAGLKPEDVNYINTHGTSTSLGDICETKAIKRTFGDYAKNGLVVSSTKSMTGHLLGAAGAIELLACVMAIQENFVPPTINVFNQDPECDLDVCPNVGRSMQVDVALSNSFGFGGHNASIIVKRFAE
ncbi:MAG: beta-ketoacyl-[acyl-carrier-protein] synthase II [Akkermansiaceae bacterium]|nr:beta-ketoacyl-[acyl-carrier-protein] synthase II [Akkermansiaceae bacterium]